MKKGTNTGDRNTGDFNSGDFNSGDWNVGDFNSGGRNTGGRNVGNWNTGDWNVGDFNSGGRNVGNWNTGDRNVGGRNVGNWNVGDRNTGDRNVGDRNVGGWNVGDRNTGYFNSGIISQIKVFDIDTDLDLWEKVNKPDFIYFNLTTWVTTLDMSQQEKDDNPSFGNTGGYLKRLDYKEAFKNYYNLATKEDREKIFNIPNFDADKFLEISGIDVRIDADKEAKKAELIAKAEALLEQAMKM